MIGPCMIFGSPEVFNTFCRCWHEGAVGGLPLNFSFPLSGSSWVLRMQLGTVPLRTGRNYPSRTKIHLWGGSIYHPPGCLLEVIWLADQHHWCFANYFYANNLHTSTFTDCPLTWAIFSASVSVFHRHFPGDLGVLTAGAELKPCPERRTAAGRKGERQHRFSGQWFQEGRVRGNETSKGMGSSKRAALLSGQLPKESSCPSHLHPEPALGPLTHSFGFPVPAPCPWLWSFICSRMDPTWKTLLSSDFWRPWPLLQWLCSVAAKTAELLTLFGRSFLQIMAPSHFCVLHNQGPDQGSCLQHKGNEKEKSIF